MALGAKLAGVGAAILMAIQFMPAPRDNPAVRGDLSAPTPVKAALESACYDCHSNQTRWPWYSAAAPVSWLLARDVTTGRQRLNFSDWSDYASDPQTQRHKLDEIAKFVASGDMAPWYYRALHPQARLSRNQRGLIVDWARTQASLTPE
jgi:Haem-binding domain